MAQSEYAVMEPSELEDKLVESRRELFNLRFQKATGQLDNTARIGHVKKDIARILTVLRQQELGIAEPGVVPGTGSAAAGGDRVAGEDQGEDQVAGEDDEEEA